MPSLPVQRVFRRQRRRLDLAGFNQTIGSLSGAGSVTLGVATLTTGNDNTSTTFSGAMSGTGGLHEDRQWCPGLTGNSRFTGATTVNGGGLVVNGSLVSGVMVNAGTLSGGGSVGGLVANGGVVAPGNVDRHLHQSTATSRRTAVSIRSRSMPPVRVTGSTSPRRRQSTARACRCWRKRHPMRATPPYTDPERHRQH